MDRQKMISYKLIRQMTVATLLSFVFLFGSLQAKAQYGLEIGFNAGVSYYMGDINYARQFYHPRHNLGASLKFHFSNRVILRLGYFNTKLVGRDADFNNTFQQVRNKEFGVSLNEISAQAEINFLPYIYGDVSRNSFTPYMQVGVAGAFVGRTANDDDFFTMAIPFGFGFKKNILPRLVLSIEWAFRWTISDMIDGITNESIKKDYQLAYGTPLTEDINMKQMGFRYTNDWYSVALVGISYTFKIGGLGCPAYYKKHDK
ncbi:MAG: hypothetical protein IKJ56_07525 [Bacteroidales bacterium]|nr:hypothetical protein [Bacteroidales bacterium]